MASRDLFGHTPRMHEFTSQASMGEALGELADFVIEEDVVVLAISVHFDADEAAHLLTGTWSAILHYETTL